MANKNVSSAYKEAKVNTASQGQLILMLYDETVRQLNMAIELLDSNKSDKKDPGSIEKIGKCLMKAEEIITELIVSLDFEQGGEISKNLLALYTWFNHELLEANISQNTERITIVRDMLLDLRTAWNDIAGKAKKEPAVVESVGLNIAG